MHDALDTTTFNRPTMTRPLFGLTVLMVEDSRFACEAIRLMGTRSGARIRRADCLASARRHLVVYRPSVLIVDMGLPDGSGADLLQEASRATPRIPVLLATSGDPFAEDVAIAAGADGFLAKPLSNLAAFQAAILHQLPADRRPTGMRAVSSDPIHPDLAAYRDDMAYAAEMLSGSTEGSTLDYVARFVSGAARSAGDRTLAAAADDLFEARMSGLPVQTPRIRMSALLDDRLSEQIAI